MMAWLAQNLAPLMFLGLVFFLLYGFPVAFALGACGLFFGLIGIELGLLSPVFFQALPLRIFGIIQNETLLAVPFFTLMGLVLERSGMAEDLLDTIGQLFGSVRGGLAFAVIFVGALLAATTGVVAASVISMGLISLPIMLRYGYDRKLASGVIAASGTLAQIIPPSLVLIVLADQLGKSVGDLYKGAFIPAFALVGLYVLYVIGLTILRPKDLPALPPEARTIRENDGSSGTRSVAVLAAIAITVGIVAGQHYNEMLAWLVGGEPKEQPVDETVVVATTFAALIAFVIALINRAFRLGLLSRMAERVTFVLIPPLALIFLVLGTIFLGVATPTEGGAMGAVGAMLLAWARKRLDRALLIQALKGTTTLSSFVMFILIGSTLFNLTFQGVGGSHWVQHLLTQLPGGQVGFLIFAALFVFVLAFFLDYFELAFIVIPLLGPAASALGIDLIWFGVLIAMVMQTSFMHPPFGFALFFLRSVAPAGEYVDAVTGKKIRGVSTAEIYWGAIPFLVLQLVMVGLLIVFPSLVTMSFSKAEKIDLEKIEIPVGDQGWGAEGAADPGRGAAGGESSW
ncbi:MAG: TRAP transporter large permease subunit [Tepidiphilus sp.]|uniref:DctM-like transporters n=2 Tax=Tepidiphilus thermophilus TaxID=876478 RepID=A0A0K6IWV1_9PROT|nr:TRAP transporter large permease subunit [Tepidiphilus thermophilus]MBP6998425.1 TRAP transporter large permease subunit [Tepidiphilus sp.]CUB07817.1 DctM-like transporters [Tepidiphilus thermophilus]